MDGSVASARLRQCSPSSNTWFLEPTRIHNPNDISIGSAVFDKLYSPQVVVTANTTKYTIENDFTKKEKERKETNTQTNGTY